MAEKALTVRKSYLKRAQTIQFIKLRHTWRSWRIHVQFSKYTKYVPNTFVEIRLLDYSHGKCETPVSGK